jgi:aspartate beta-hydroxylase
LKGWKEGKVTVIDDSWEHEVWNNSSSARAVLIVDVWHPLLSETTKTMLREQMRGAAAKAAEFNVHGH